MCLSRLHKPLFQEPSRASEPRRKFAFRKDLRGSRHFCGFWSYVKHFRLWCGTKNIAPPPSFNSPRICYKVKRLAESFRGRGGSRSAWRTGLAGGGRPCLSRFLSTCVSPSCVTLLVSRSPHTAPHHLPVAHPLFSAQISSKCPKSTLPDHVQASPPSLPLREEFPDLLSPAGQEAGAG